MDFLLTIIINIFIGALLYLIISLKLEKSASEFQEKRLRKEMDDIIKEFNSTAERNISILENRIAVMKKLLKYDGIITSFDVKIGDPVESKSEVEADGFKVENKNEIIEDLRYFPVEKNTKLINNTVKNRMEKKGLLLFIEKVINLKNEFRGNHTASENIILDKSESAGLSSRKDDAGPVYSPVSGAGKDKNFLIEKDFNDINIEYKNTPGKNDINDEEIQKIISSEDKYSMISILNKKGLTDYEISKYSGIPEGEVKLVLNINNSR